MLPWAGVSRGQEEKIPLKGVVRISVTHDNLLKIQYLCYRFGLSRNTRGGLSRNRSTERPLKEPIWYEIYFFFHFSLSCFQWLLVFA